MMVYTWWCWHICKGEEVGEVLEKLELKKRSDGTWFGILY
jgi:hypothetical protein